MTGTLTADQKRANADAIARRKHENYIHIGLRAADEVMRRRSEMKTPDELVDLMLEMERQIPLDSRLGYRTGLYLKLASLVVKA